MVLKRPLVVKNSFLFSSADSDKTLVCLLFLNVAVPKKKKKIRLEGGGRARVLLVLVFPKQ